MQKSKRYSTPNTVMYLFFLIGQVFAFAFVLFIFRMMTHMAPNDDYLFGSVTILDLFPYLFVAILLMNLIQYNKFPVWALMDETGIGTVCFFRTKPLEAWDRFVDVGIIAKGGKSYIYFSDYELTDEQRADLTKISFKVFSTVVIYDDETAPIISSFYRGEMRDYRKQSTI